MCGIVGILRKGQSVDPAEVEAMNSHLVHRGPDGFGVHVHENVGIGHRRLSLIDLEGGKQPMSDDSGRYHITFNGEIYNFLELQKELRDAGVQFTTRSDTEVVLYAYLHWGEDCVNRLRGMFAFCVVDTVKRQLFMARDHLGIKPLFYAKQNGFVAFASELQAFKGVQGFESDLDLRAVDEFLWLQYIPAPRTVFKNVYKLKPGHSLVIGFGGEVGEPRSFWEVKFKPDQKLTLNDAVDKLEAELKASVKAHLVADVPFGAFLSGGLDSTLVVTYMAELLKHPVKTFSIGFNEKSFSELPYARQVAEQLGTEHHEEIVEVDALGILPELVKHAGEPFGDSSLVPTYFVSKLASKHVKMVLSGDGGDEAFGGYKTYTDFMHWELAHGQSSLKRIARAGLEKVMPSRFPKRGTLNNWFNYITYFQHADRLALWKGDYHTHVHARQAEFEDFWARTADFDTAQKLQYMDMRTYMPYDILTKVDIASMYHSLEVRTPLVDKEIWNFAATLPTEYTVHAMEGAYSGKFVMKKLLERHFPKEFVYRKKMGFSIPSTFWFDAENSSGNAIRERLMSPDTHISKYFNAEAIDKQFAEKRVGRIWLMLFLEYWLDDFHSDNRA